MLLPPGRFLSPERNRPGKGTAPGEAAGRYLSNDGGLLSFLCCRHPSMEMDFSPSPLSKIPLSLFPLPNDQSLYLQKPKITPFPQELQNFAYRLSPCAFSVFLAALYWVTLCLVCFLHFLPGQ